MIYKTSNAFQKQKVIERFKILLEKEAIIELKEKKFKRTLKQNRYLHLILGWFALETGYTPEEVKQEIFKKIVNPVIFYDGEYGELVEVQRWRSSAELNTSELTQCIENFRDYAVQEAGIYLPTPEERESLEEIEIELINQKLL